MKTSNKRGSLLIVGGSEDRTGQKDVLARFVELAGGKDKSFVVLTAASEVPADVWELYQEAFDDLGVGNVEHILTCSREQADQREAAARVRAAAGIFMTGGAQARLLEILGGSAIEAAMRAAYEDGACIAGTSAGASALCADMLMNGKARLVPEKDAIETGHGFGFISGVIVDQHFSQRHRINRLLSVTAENPAQFGIGIDEDTALVVQPGVGIEVVGDGSLTVIDCRRANTNVEELPSGATPVMLNVRLHVLPTGVAWHLGDSAPAHSLLPAHAAPAPEELNDLIHQLTNINRKQPA